MQKQQDCVTGTACHLAAGADGAAAMAGNMAGGKASSGLPMFAHVSANNGIAGAACPSGMSEAQAWTTIERAQTLIEQWVRVGSGNCQLNWTLSLSKENQTTLAACCEAMRFLYTNAMHSGNSEDRNKILQAMRNRMSPAAGALFETIKSEAALLSPTTQQDHESEPSGMDGGSKSKRRRTSALSANAGMRASDGADHFHPRLAGKTVVIFVDFQFEDLELMYPKIRLEEEGAKVVICGIHEAPMKYTGKYGYPITSDITIAKLDVASVDGLIIPGGFAPDFMRRSHLMLDAISALNARRVPIGAICHGGWMLCSARHPHGKPLISGRSATGFIAIRDDLINAGAYWFDLPVVVDENIVTSRTPQDLTPFCQALIKLISATSVVPTAALNAQARPATRKRSTNYHLCELKACMLAVLDANRQCGHSSNDTRAAHAAEHYLEHCIALQKSNEWSETVDMKASSEERTAKNGSLLMSKYRETSQDIREQVLGLYRGCFTGGNVDGEFLEGCPGAEPCLFAVRKGLHKLTHMQKEKKRLQEHPEEFTRTEYVELKEDSPWTTQAFEMFKYFGPDKIGGKNDAMFMLEIGLAKVDTKKSKVREDQKRQNAVSSPQAPLGSGGGHALGGVGAADSSLVAERTKTLERLLELAEGDEEKSKARNELRQHLSSLLQHL